MPIYEYSCQSCHFEKDVLQKLSDPVLTNCPECKEESFVKQISAPGFRLKGAGWYETDFKTGKKKNLAGGSEADSSGKSSSGNNSTNKNSTGKNSTGKNSTENNGTGKTSAGKNSSEKSTSAS